MWSKKNHQVLPNEDATRCRTMSIFHLLVNTTVLDCPVYSYTIWIIEEGIWARVLVMMSYIHTTGGPRALAGEPRGVSGPQPLAPHCFSTSTCPDQVPISAHDFCSCHQLRVELLLDFPFKPLMVWPDWFISSFYRMMLLVSIAG